MIVSIITNKGGTAKTTTSVSLAQALARENKKVLVIDNDSQSNATSLLLKTEPESRQSLYRIYSSDDVDISDCVHFTEFQQNLYCIPNIADTASLEPVLIKKGVDDGFPRLRNVIRNYVLENYDYTLIDNPPNHGIFAINSLYTSDCAIVPTDAGSKSSVRGLVKAIQFIEDIREEGNPDLKFLRLLITKVDRRTAVSKVITTQLETNFGKDRMFETAIPINTAIQKAELLDETIFKHDPKSGGAKAYRQLGKEFLKILE